MSTPNLDLEQVPSNSLQPSVPVNDALQVLDCLVQLSVEDKDLTAPPSTVSGDIGKSWIVGGSATGAWSGQDGKVALCTAADVWRFLPPKEGWKAFVRDEDDTYLYTTSWVLDSGGGGGGIPPVVIESTTNLDADASNAGNYTRFTNASGKTYTFDDAESYVVGAEYHGRNANTGNLTLTEAGGMTINPPADGTLVIPPGGTFTVKIVASDEADLFGVTVSA